MPEPEPEPEPEQEGQEVPGASNAAGKDTEQEDEYIIHNRELRALVEDLGGIAKVRALTQSDDAETRQTAIDAMAMIDLEARKEMDTGRSGVVTPAEGDAGKVESAEQYTDEDWEEEV